MNLPNILTMVRIALIPVFMVLAAMDNRPAQLAAVAVYAIACITDFVDGKLARKYNLVTNFGKFMDPMADKLLVMAAMMIFVADGTMPAWAAVIILAREFAVSAIRLIAAEQGTVIAANMWGKAKTMVTMIVLIFLLCRFPAISLFAGLTLQDLGVYVMVAITAISGYTYLKDNFAIFKDGFSSGKKGE